MAKKRGAASKPAGPRRPADAGAEVAADAGTEVPAPTASPGKQRREALRKERDALDRARPPVMGTVEEPVFFFGFQVAWAKLVVLRVVVFAVLALDALLQISHAPRYGAGGFNVAHLPLFDLIAPGRALYATGQLVSAYLLVLAACGVATRVVLPIATALYAWLYFGSHLDSYQHHYLVFLLLVLSCAVPWQRPPDATPATPVRSWALRLVLLQLAIVYLWAAISKLSPAWLDGRTLDAQMHGRAERMIESTIGMSGAAWLIVSVELVLASTIWWRRGWLVAAPLGLALHASIVETGLEIGLFAWLMLGIYILVIPDRVWVWLAETAPMRAARAVAHVVSTWFHGSMRFVLWAFAAITGTVLAMLSRFDQGPAVGLALVITLSIGTVVAVLRRKTHVAWLAVAHLLAFVVWTGVDRFTTTASDYYRFWGGSSRRLGDPKAAEHAYRRMTEVAPNQGQGFFQLGRLLLSRDAEEEGLAAIRRAQELEPLRARTYVAEARWLATHGKRDEAIEKARVATILEPGDVEARALLDSLLSGRPIRP
jgi:hypothetical protein